MIIDCEPSPLYTLHEYVLPEFIARAMSVVCIKINYVKSIKLYNIIYLKIYMYNHLFKL